MSPTPIELMETAHVDILKLFEKGDRIEVLRRLALVCCVAHRYPSDDNWDLFSSLMEHTQWIADEVCSSSVLGGQYQEAVRAAHREFYDWYSEQQAP